ncbi:MAG: cytochrome c oxidase assembly protein [Anaerolineales bacterium]
MMYDGPLLNPDTLWQAWNFEPSILVPLVLTILLYVWGIQKFWHRTGHGFTHKIYLSFLGTLLALVLAFVSPLDALSEALFSAHMVQHMILILVAAPLLVKSDFHLALLWVLPRQQAHTLGNCWNRLPTLHLITNPIFTCSLFTVTLWSWHASRLFETALHNKWVHSLEHLDFLVSAILFWWVLLKPATQKRLHYGMAIPYLFATVLQSGILGALMSFSSEAWYPYYTSFVSLWKITLLQDQQLAGLIMWIPGGTVFTLLTIGYFAAWLDVLEKHEVLPANNDLLNKRG